MHRNYRGDTIVALLASVIASVVMGAETPDGPTNLCRTLFEKAKENALVRQRQENAASETLAKTAIQTLVESIGADLSAPRARQQALDRLAETLQVDIKLTPEHLTGSIAEYSASGEAVGAFAGKIQTLQEELGAIHAPREGENSLSRIGRAFGRRIPFVGRMVSRRLNSVETPAQAVERLRKRVGDLITEGQQMRDAKELEEAKLRIVAEQLAKKVQIISLLRNKLAEDIGYLDPVSPEAVFLRQIMTKLHEAEESHTVSQVIVLGQIDRGDVIQKSLRESLSVLQNKTYVDLMNLEFNFSHQVAAQVGLNMLEAAVTIKNASDELNLAVAKEIRRVNSGAIALQREGFNREAHRLASNEISATREEQEKYNEERERLRNERIADLQREKVELTGRLVRDEADRVIQRHLSDTGLLNQQQNSVLESRKD